MPSSIFLPQPRLSEPSLSSRAKKYLNARSLFSLLANLNQLAKKLKVLQVEVKVTLVEKVVDVDHLDVDAAALVVVVDEVVVQAE